MFYFLIICVVFIRVPYNESTAFTKKKKKHSTLFLFAAHPPPLSPKLKKKTRWKITSFNKGAHSRAWSYEAWKTKQLENNQRGEFAVLKRSSKERMEVKAKQLAVAI